MKRMPPDLKDKLAETLGELQAWLADNNARLELSHKSDRYIARLYVRGPTGWEPRWAGSGVGLPDAILDAVHVHESRVFP